MQGRAPSPDWHRGLQGERGAEVRKTTLMPEQHCLGRPSIHACIHCVSGTRMHQPRNRRPQDLGTSGRANLHPFPIVASYHVSLTYPYPLRAIPSHVAILSLALVQLSMRITTLWTT